MTPVFVVVLNFEMQLVYDEFLTVNCPESERIRSDWHRLCHKKWINHSDPVVWSVEFVSLTILSRRIRERFFDWSDCFRTFSLVTTAFGDDS